MPSSSQSGCGMPWGMLPSNFGGSASSSLLSALPPAPPQRAVPPVAPLQRAALLLQAQADAQAQAQLVAAGLPVPDRARRHVGVPDGGDDPNPTLPPYSR